MRGAKMVPRQNLYYLHVSVCGPACVNKRKLQSAVFYGASCEVENRAEDVQIDTKRLSNLTLVIYTVVVFVSLLLCVPLVASPQP